MSFPIVNNGTIFPGFPSIHLSFLSVTTVLFEGWHHNFVLTHVSLKNVLNFNSVTSSKNIN